MLQFHVLKTKNFSDRKLKGAMIGIGINLAYFASRPIVIRDLRKIVPNIQNKIKLTKYLAPALE
jgi:hypothetical protein